jgi:cytoskeletal protein CcmA (bactofilin family)
MWRKQSDVKPSSPAVPPTRDSSYAPPSQGSQKPATPESFPAATAPRASYVQTQAPAPSPNSAVLTRGICIKGELSGKADLLIDGDVQGSIRLGESRLTVGQAGHIKADIEAAEIVVRGQVDGDLRGRERIVLGDSCRVAGDLEAPRIAIEDGARFKGRVEMGPAADARERQNKRAPQTFVSNEPVASVDAAENMPVGAGTQRSSN